MKPKPLLERKQQIQYVGWFKSAYPNLTIYHTPNGERRDRKTGGLLKRMGVLAGVLDLFVPEKYLYIEMKRTKSDNLTLRQTTFKKIVEVAGYTVIIGYGVQDAIDKTLNFMKSQTHEQSPHDF